MTQSIPQFWPLEILNRGAVTHAVPGCLTHGNLDVINGSFFQCVVICYCSKRQLILTFWPGSFWGKGVECGERNKPTIKQIEKLENGNQMGKNEVGSIAHSTINKESSGLILSVRCALEFVQCLLEKWKVITWFYFSEKLWFCPFKASLQTKSTWTGSWQLNHFCITSACSDKMLFLHKCASSMVTIPDFLAAGEGTGPIGSGSVLGTCYKQGQWRPSQILFPLSALLRRKQVPLGAWPQSKGSPDILVPELLPLDSVRTLMSFWSITFTSWANLNRA